MIRGCLLLVNLAENFVLYAVKSPIVNVVINEIGDGKVNVLLAGEESQIVTEAFIKKGHNAMSCDNTYPGAKGLPHYFGDMLDIIYRDYWDLVIAFPVCRFLANSGVRWLYERPGRWELLKEGAEFFNKILKVKCKLAIENPIHHCHARKLITKYDQIIHPWQFGHTTKKTICLWLRGLPKLQTTNIIPKELRTPDIHYESPGPERERKRSRFYEGIADAMANQWG